MRNIEKLNDGQFAINHENKAMFSINDKYAKKLVRKGKKINKTLIDNLNDSTKTIMLHWVLCQINFGKVSFAGPKEITINESRINQYFLGKKEDQGLLIYSLRKNGNYQDYVSKANREEILNYWQSYLNKK
ncbi:MAG: hypothetical protein AB7O73_11965 [Bacteroidia bacterium]